MAIRKELLDELLKDYKSPEDLLGPGGLLKQRIGIFSRVFRPQPITYFMSPGRR